jgi:hypothetical protein
MTHVLKVHASVFRFMKRWPRLATYSCKARTIACNFILWKFHEVLSENSHTCSASPRPMRTCARLSSSSCRLTHTLNTASWYVYIMRSPILQPPAGIQKLRSAICIYSKYMVKFWRWECSRLFKQGQSVAPPMETSKGSLDY